MLKIKRLYIFLFIKMLIVIPIEIKTREFLPKLYLIYKIIKYTNFTVLFGSQRELTNKVKGFKNIIFFDKGTNHNRFLNNGLNLKNNHVMMLSEEGPVSYFDNYALGIHYDQNLNKIVDEFFFWGKNDLFKLPKKIFSKKINIFGHPKFDLLNQNNGIFFNEKSEILKKKYGNFILFSSSFERPISKSMLLSRYLSYYKNLSKDKILNLCNKEFRDLSENQKNFKEVIKLLFEIAKKFPKLKVIFRKHPNQKYSDFIELFKNKPSNLILVYDNIITPWIKACKVYIHSGCTTVHEAFMLRKKILFFNKNNQKRLKNFEKIGLKSNNIPLSIKLIEKLLLKKFKVKNLDSQIGTIINYKKNFFFYKNFLKILKQHKNLKSEIIFHKKNNFFEDIIFKLRNILIKVLSVIKNEFILKTPLVLLFSEKHTFSKESKLNKLPFIKSQEIKNVLLRLMSIEKKKFNFDIKKFDKNLFLIKKSDNIK